MTYAEALKHPTRPGGEGWAHAPAESTLAATAQILGGRNCLSPAPLYDWAQRHKISLLHDVITEDEQPMGALLIAVLNDVSIENARAMLNHLE